MGPVIVAESLTKKYKSKAVVNQLDLKIPGGSILGLIKPSKGNIQILGRELNPRNRLNILSETGSLIESPAYYGHLTGKENLQVICTLKNIPETEISRVLHIVRMEEQQNKKVSQYSLGMKQRLGLAAALLGNPKLLLLDEPTNGLDPAGIQEMRELIVSLPSTYGITVLISSHLLSEMDQMATHVGIINQGELIFQDSLSVLHKHSRSRLLLSTSDDPSAFQYLKHSKIPVQWSEGKICLKTENENQVMQAVSLLVHSGIGILRLEEQQMSLEDIFLNLTGKQVSL